LHHILLTQYATKPAGRSSFGHVLSHDTLRRVLWCAQVAELCEAANKEVSADQAVKIANYLCNGNYAVSGGLQGCEAVEKLAKSFKARYAQWALHSHGRGLPGLGLGLGARGMLRLGPRGAAA
jgi:malonyl CoA-acyl carrier protein transacylase